MTEVEKLPKFAQRAFERLQPGMLLIRTSSDSDEAVEKGGGFLYSIEPGGRKFPTASGKMLIDEGLLAPNGDGLIAEVSQTYRREAS